MKKLLFFLFFAILTASLYSQDNVKPNYTKPYFQGNVKVKDTLGVPNVLVGNRFVSSLNDSSYIELKDNILQLGNGKSFFSLSGNGTNKSAFFLSSYDFFVENASGMNFSTNGISFFYSRAGFTKASYMDIVDNETTAFTSANLPGFPGHFLTRKATINIGLVNSASIGGRDIKLKTNYSAYANRYIFNTGENFETVLDYITPTADRLIQLQDGDGTVAFLSDIPGAATTIYNGNGSISSNRYISLGSNIIDFGTGLGSGITLDPTNFSIVTYSPLIGSPTGTLITQGNNNTWIMPSGKDGTVALTSDINGVYLPLSGGTMAGDIELLTNKLKSTGTLELQTGNNFLDIRGISETLRFDLSLLNGVGPASPIIATFQNAGGTIAYLSDIPTPTGDGIYSGSGSLSAATSVSLGAFNLDFLTFGGSGKIDFTQTVNSPNIDLYNSAGVKKIHLDGGSTAFSNFANSVSIGHIVGTGATLDVLGDFKLTATGTETPGYILSTDATGLASWINPLNSERGEFYMQGNTTQTIITSTNTPVLVAGTTTAGISSAGISIPDTNRITNTSGETREFYTTISFTAYKVGGGGGIDATFYIAIDGVIQGKSGIQRALTGRAGAVNIQCLANVADNSYIELYVENNSNTQNIVVENINAISKTSD